ncbi:MAG: hypothetical protein LBU22_09780 [Dysgonamonadaceae bacterium]|jgi:hypothetical protein|nr:hypothetical protein [Dysgonamonadaceae bacterium]
MYKSLLYKEWIKTRSVIACLAVIFLGVGIYSFMKISESIRLLGIVNLWETTIQKDPAMFPQFKYLPLLAGILLAITQYVPELQFKRLKLTLHLPLNENKILLTMLLYGVTAVLSLLLITLPILLLGLGQRFPSEIVWTGFQQLAPWFLAGPAAYLIAAWICLEPQWKQRILTVIPGIIALSFFFLRAKSGAYQPFDLYLILLVIVAFFFAFYSTARFKEGVQ